MYLEFVACCYVIAQVYRGYKCSTVPAFPLKNNGGHIQLTVVRDFFFQL